MITLGDNILIIIGFSQILNPQGNIVSKVYINVNMVMLTYNCKVILTYNIIDRIIVIDNPLSYVYVLS